MPRKGPYVAWTKRTVVSLLGMDDERVDPDWRNAQEGVDWKSQHDQKPDYRQEEAVLIQTKGFENESPCVKCASGDGKFRSCISVPGICRSACGNCVWQSKGADCKFARDSMHAEAAEKEEQSSAKTRLKRARDLPQSSRRSKKSRPVPIDDDDDDDDDVARPPAKKPKSKPKSKKGSFRISKNELRGLKG